jgi:predicted DNA-binding protein
MKNKDNLSKQIHKYTIRIENKLLNKIVYIAECEGLTKNEKFEQLIKNYIADFEDKHGKIKL